MTVNEFMRFIKKYNLNGLGADRLIINSDNEGSESSITAVFHDKHRFLSGKVSMETEFELDTMLVNSTKDLVSILGALDQTVHLSMEVAEKNANCVITKMKISDSRTNAFLVGADPLSISEVRTMKKIPDWDVVFKPDLITTF